MDNSRLWKSVLSELELTVSRPIFKTQFSGSVLLSYENGVATVGLSNPMVRTMVETRYYSLVKSVLDHHTKENTSVVFVVLPKKDNVSDRPAGPLFETAATTPDPSAAARKLHLKPELTFRDFAVSSTNQIAYAAATAVAQSPGSAYNPLFFYGGVGVGKTHLMQAVANEALQKKPNTRIVYCMGEEFLNEIIEAIQTKSARQFKQKYRSAQILMVDDVQFIAGKQTAQEEFFHTFNAVLREGGQVILTSDRPPGEISRLEDRLRSRFEGGLIVDINQPDFELRAAIVNIKSKNLGLSVPPEAAQMIAANTTDARAIEGLLRRLSTELFTGKSAITADLVSQVLKHHPGAASSQGTNRKTSPHEILEAVANHYSVRPSTLKGPKRDRPIARPRQVIMYLCKVEMGLTLDDIGGLLGGRDHTTVMHGVETITRELSTNNRLRSDVEEIKNKLWVIK
ncbi:chromosomal replication initiator protein DnaA [Candidatus Gottesmanbacteria bacterium RBG_16_52_11]|uniref:Chromosomal replication initiator protein DnaA n=1 Tax=Candidatus Gottesmanbacteria bacterium RBG_16_52_11 TaxID=1798374 RepID=A0A1F5YP50_9BACT|nr:MAG: chromosomal replication initiator protein DnaA [Candidatus Gottesmanbacteria bacterium RBG_16_52_11]